MKHINEYSIAASYYEDRFGRRDRFLKGGESKVQSQPWEEDTWTSTDEENAKQILENHIEKCSISSLLTTGEKDSYTETEDADAWDQFYTDHGNRFFKDRHYFEKAFPEEFPPSLATHATVTKTNVPTTGLYDIKVQRKTLVEIGCGVGNAILPLLELGESDGNWDVVHGLDISREAIQILQKDPRFQSFNDNSMSSKRKVYGHVCDISRELPPPCSGISDVTTLIFCLSAIDPERQLKAAEHVVNSLKPGGVLLFRDYGRYDEAQMKLGTSRSKRIKENYYRKHDGTKCYYFALEDIERIFCEVLGMRKLELKYLRRVYGNKATAQVRRRIWIQGRFRKLMGKEFATD